MRLRPGSETLDLDGHGLGAGRSPSAPLFGCLARFELEPRVAVVGSSFWTDTEHDPRLAKPSPGAVDLHTSKSTGHSARKHQFTHLSLVSTPAEPPEPSGHAARQMNGSRATLAP